MPELAAAYFGAMRARLIYVPLDLRMSVEAIENIVQAAETRHLILGTGRDAPDPREARLEHFPTTTLEALCAEPEPDDPTFPPDWESTQAAWEPPGADDIFQLVFTSGTTGIPKGVMLAHDNILASIESFHAVMPHLEHRIVSLLPLSHLLEQAVGLFYALSVGADVLYVRSRNPRVIFDALRDHKVTSMVVVPAGPRPVLERGHARGRETRQDRHLRSTSRRRSAPADGRPASHLRQRPRPAGRPPPTVRLERGVPAARTPAGLGGSRGHRHAGLRRHRDRHRQLHDAQGPRAGDGRAAAGRDPDAALTGR